MIAVALVAACVAHVYTQEAASALADCAGPALQASAPRAPRSQGAKPVEATGKLPKYCQVDGHIATPGNEVNFRLGLPERWNGKYYFVGVGGLGGTHRIASTRASHAATPRHRPTPVTCRRSDLGFEPREGDRLRPSRHARHRGCRQGADAARIYGQTVQHAYFNGCSNGGRQALMEVQRYPTDFDGIIAGDPATGTPMQVGTRARLPEDALAARELPDRRQDRTALEGDARRVRQDRRPRRRPHHRSASAARSSPRR